MALRSLTRKQHWLISPFRPSGRCDCLAFLSSWSARYLLRGRQPASRSSISSALLCQVKGRRLSFR